MIGFPVELNKRAQQAGRMCAVLASRRNGTPYAPCAKQGGYWRAQWFDHCRAATRSHSSGIVSSDGFLIHLRAHLPPFSPTLQRSAHRETKRTSWWYQLRKVWFPRWRLTRDVLRSLQRDSVRGRRKG
jgi:hypothetical protein